MLGWLAEEPAELTVVPLVQVPSHISIFVVFFLFCLWRVLAIRGVSEPS